MSSSESEICAECGREIAPSEQAYVFEGKVVCAECDKKLRQRSAAPPTAMVSNLTNIQTEAKYKGVGGWLLLFCLILTVFTPLLVVILFFTGLSENMRILAEYPQLRTPFIICGLLEVGVIGFGVYAGISLWRIRPNAVTVAKAFLGVQLGVAVIGCFLLLVAAVDITGGVNEHIVWEFFIRPVGRAWLFRAILRWYLNKSKRVKATYPEYSKAMCPQCGRSLRGVSKEMVGDIGVCPKCKAEFVIGSTTKEKTQ